MACRSDIRMTNHRAAATHPPLEMRARSVDGRFTCHAAGGCWCVASAADDLARGARGSGQRANDVGKKRLGEAGRPSDTPGRDARLLSLAGSQSIACAVASEGVGAVSRPNGKRPSCQAVDKGRVSRAKPKRQRPFSPRVSRGCGMGLGLKASLH